jgi:hypothetical protein
MASKVLQILQSQKKRPVTHQLISKNVIFVVLGLVVRYVSAEAARNKASNSLLFYREPG